MTVTRPIGAWVEILYLDNSSQHRHYFSFGEVAEDEDEDTFGVPDDEIFYFCEEGESDLEKLKTNTLDFKVLSYDLVYDKKNKDNE